MYLRGEEPKKRQPGPFLDRSVRILIEDDPNAFCDWLGEQRAQDVKVLSGSFPAETLHADFVGQIGPDRLIHVEYVGKPDREMAVRMVAYLAQLMRIHPGFSIAQYALVQGKGRLPSVDDPRTGFTLGQTTVYLRDCDPASMPTDPGLGGLAVLVGRDDKDRVQSLRAAVQRTRGMPQNRKWRLIEAMAALASTNLDPSTVEQIIEESDMTVESVAAFYRDTKFGREIHKEGLEEGIETGAVRLLTALLRTRFGNDPRIPELAQHLARGADPDTSSHLITETTSLDDLSDRLLSNRLLSSTH